MVAISGSLIVIEPEIIAMDSVSEESSRFAVATVPRGVMVNVP